MSHKLRTWVPSALLAAVMACATGCTPKMKAIEHEGQTVLHKGDAALVERQGLAVVVTPVQVMIEEPKAIAGFRIEVINQTDHSIRLDYHNAVLTGGDGLKRPPIDPKVFRRYAEMAQGDPPPRWAAYPRPVFMRVNPVVGGWDFGYPYGYWGPPFYDESPYYYYEDYVQEYYRRRERLARFVSRLWRDNVVRPGFVVGGYIVFQYDLRKKDHVVLELTLNRLATSRPTTTPSSLPTTQLSSHPLVPTEPGPVVLHFYFDT
jgi:hypothetical protein